MPEQFFATTPEQFPDRAKLAAMSGLEFIEAIRDGHLPGAPIAGILNFRIHTVAMGEVTFRGTPAFDHFNPMGMVHGGWYGTLLDSAMGCAVATTLPRGRWYTTLEYKINITRALPAGMLVDCTARVSHAGRSTGVAEGWVRGVEDGKLYATGSTTCIIMGG